MLIRTVRERCEVQFTCSELCPCTEISIVSSQLELLETLYLPLSREGGQPRINCCLILAAAKDAVCLHSWREGTEGRTEEGGERNSAASVCHKNLKEIWKNEEPID